MRHGRFYTLVGVFVVGALFLLILGVAFFYEEYKRAQTQTFVMFFRGSLTGLVTGSAVTFRGVKIGEVQAIEITENKAKTKVRIPVYVQFFVEKSFGRSQDPVNLLIHNGFVATISKPNFITGMSVIELVAAPSARAFKQTYYRSYPIFPTINAPEKFIGLDEAIDTAQKTLKDIRELVQSKDVRETINATKKMANSVEHLAHNLDENVPEIREAINATQTMAKSVEHLANNLERNVPEIREAMNSTKSMAIRVEQLATHMDLNIPPVVAYLTSSLKELTNAAYSTKNLTDYLSRYPESLLRGKP